MKNKSTIVFGTHSVKNLIQRRPASILELLLLPKEDHVQQAILQMAESHNIAVVRVAKARLDQIAAGANHQGIVAICQKLDTLDENGLFDLLPNIMGPPLLLILDGVQDPHNLGACFRSADAFGVHCIITNRDRAVGLTPTVSKVASGAVETIPFAQVTNLVRVLEKLKAAGVWLYGTDAAAKIKMSDADLKGAVGLIMGAEGKGLRRLTREHCDVLVHIPMLGQVASLNVSVATGIGLYEVQRQRSAI